MRITGTARALAAVLAGTAAMIIAGGVASASETGIIIGRKNCEQVAKQYRDMGYRARCYNTHGDRFYVDYQQKKPGELEMPSTGSAGSS